MSRLISSTDGDIFRKPTVHLIFEQTSIFFTECSFSEQLKAIRNYTLADVICQHLPGETHLQSWAMVLPGTENAKFPCADHSKLNLESWKDSEGAKPKI